MFDIFENEDSQIDITPLIDVVFMLLIFFIMTTTFSRPVLDIVLPKASQSEPVTKRQKEFVVSIKSDGTVVHEDNIIAKEDLLELLQKQPGALLNLHVDEKAPFESFVDVINIAKETRGGHFVISTRDMAR